MRLFSPRVLITLARETLREFGADHCSLMAAGISYYVIFSIFPLLLFLISVLSFFLTDADAKERVVNVVLEQIPLTQDEGRDFIRQLIDQVIAARGVLGVLGLAGVIWSASAIFGAMRTALNVVWDIERKRPLVQQKLIDLSLVLGVGLFFLLSLGSTTLLQIVRNLTDEALGPISQATGVLWNAAFLVLPGILSFMGFTVLFHFLPNTQVRWREALFGALIAALLFEVGKNAFAIYVRNFGNYQATYGALGGLFAFLFWTYLSASFMLLGAEAAAELPRVLRGDYWRERPEHEEDELSWQEKALRAARGLVLSRDDRR